MFIAITNIGLLQYRARVQAPPYFPRFITLNTLKAVTSCKIHIKSNIYDSLTYEIGEISLFFL